MIPSRAPALTAASALALATACSPGAESPPAAEPSRASSAITGSPRGASGEIFIDQAAASGLKFDHFNGMSGELYIGEMMQPGGALLDYDNDGDLDAYLVQGTMLNRDKTYEDAIFPPLVPLPPKDRLFRNDLVIRDDGTRALRFTDVTEESGIDARGYGYGVATGDYDNDGWVDLYVTNLGPNQMFRNRGDGTFEEVTDRTGTGDRRWSVAAAFFDYDHDSFLDLYVGNYIDFHVTNHNDCYAGAGYIDYCGPKAYNPEPDRLFRNRGDGTFEDASRRAGLGSTVGAGLGAIPADFNLDGWIDLYVANDGMRNRLWVNQGDGTFADDALLAGCAVNADGSPEGSMGVDAADFDNDGDEDLIMTHIDDETNTFYLNDGTGIFEDSTVPLGLATPSKGLTGFGTGWFDYDNDGALDLIVVNGAVVFVEELFHAKHPFPLHQPNQLFRNLGGGRFEEVTDRAGEVFELSEVTRGAAFGDVDNDGDPDVLIVNCNGPARLLVNQVGQENSWVGLRLIGRDVERDMLGAWVGVFPEGRPPQWRRVRTAGSYASASDPRVLIGLGGAGRIERVEVQWPDGSRESWDGPPVREYTTLRQGSGRPGRSGS
jgi:hypothetical protein